MDLKNKKVIITGATGGIGNSLVKKFHESGAHILATGTKEEKLNKLKDKFINSDDILITRERHRQHLEQCVLHLENFKNKSQAEDFDKAAEDLRLATRHLGIIVGKVDVEEVLGSIFNDFCIGK